MAPLPDYVSGTITLTNGSAAFTGSGTGWLAASFREGDTILGIEDNPGVTYVIESITDNDAGTLTQSWQGATGTYSYRMRYLSDGQRVTAQARTLIELLGNGNLAALAGLDGTPQTLPMFTGTGAMVEVPRTDLVSGVAYDVQVDTLADRDAYDGQPEGFSVLVADIGDGRAAIYSRVGGSGWSDPAYVTGPSITLDVGSVTPVAFGNDPDVTLTSVPGGYEFDFEMPAAATLGVGSTTTGDPGTAASVDLTPVAGGYQIDFTIPAGEGFSAEGDYSGATAYAKGDVVQDAGSSWIALQATTGNAPPTLPTTSNAYWQLLAQAGADGDIDGVTPFWQGRITVDATAEAARAGLGAVGGPSSAVDGQIALFDGTTGKLLKDSGLKPEDIGSVDQLFTDDLTAEFDANEKAQARANIGLENRGYFVKADPRAAAFTRTGNGTISVKAGTIVEVDGGIFTYHNAEPVTMPGAMNAGDDLAVWIRPDGQPVATADFVSPPVANSRQIGGLHYAPGGNATAFNTGGNTTPQINEFSLWDLKFRPACPDPRGMALVANSFWCDIYLLGVNHHNDGTSRYNVTIADGAAPPKVPTMFGGNGSTAYSTLNWWEAAEVLQSHGKELLNYDEFAAMAYGVKENQSGGTDPVTTILRADYTSKWGMMLATGNLYVWGREFSYREDGTATAQWYDVNGGRGQVYLRNGNGLVAALFGGSWGHAADSGSRASYWNVLPWHPHDNLGARGRSDHLNLEA